MCPCYETADRELSIRNLVGVGVGRTKFHPSKTKPSRLRTTEVHRADGELVGKNPHVVRYAATTDGTTPSLRAPGIAELEEILLVILGSRCCAKGYRGLLLASRREVSCVGVRPSAAAPRLSSTSAWRRGSG